MTETHLAVFKGKKIRRTLHNNEWWFVINDVIESLTDSNDPAQYFKRLKQRDEELARGNSGDSILGGILGTVYLIRVCV